MGESGKGQEGDCCGTERAREQVIPWCGQRARLRRLGQGQEQRQEIERWRNSHERSLAEATGSVRARSAAEGRTAGYWWGFLDQVKAMAMKRVTRAVSCVRAAEEAWKGPGAMVGDLKVVQLPPAAVERTSCYSN